MTRYAHVFRLFTAPFIAAALMLFLLPIRCFAVTQEELETIEAQREVLETRRDNIEKKVSELSASHASALEQKAALDERNQITLKQIKLLMDQIDLCDTILKQKEKEVEAAKQKETEQLEKFRARVRSMEENENYSILDLLLTSSSIGEFISAMEDMQVIVESDKKLADDYMSAREEAERVRNEYLSVKNEYKEHLDVLNAEQGKLERQIAEADALIISQCFTRRFDSNRRVLLQSRCKYIRRKWWLGFPLHNHGSHFCESFLSKLAFSGFYIADLQQHMLNFRWFSMCCCTL